MRRAGVQAGVIVAVALAIAPAAAWAGRANGGLRGAPATNPLAGMRWGLYTGPIDNLYPAYVSATGRRKAMLARIVSKPRTVWLAAWAADASAGTVTRQVIEASTGGDPNALTQLALFRLDPWEGAACHTTPGRAAQASYKRWIDNVAAGIGQSRVTVILQPDLPFALCAPTQVPLQLVAAAARRLNALPHTTVYIDVGTVAWASVPNAASLLIRAGIRHARGFALNATQFGGTAQELEYGDKIVNALAAAGIGDKRFVINTDQNGSPFLAGQYRGDINNPRVCRTAHDAVCVRLGIPPTTDVANPRWGLDPASRQIAARECDAYLWIGRPWMDNGESWPFDFGRAVALGASALYP